MNKEATIKASERREREERVCCEGEEEVRGEVGEVSVVGVDEGDEMDWKEDDCCKGI